MNRILIIKTVSFLMLLIFFNACTEQKTSDKEISSERELVPEPDKEERIAYEKNQKLNTLVDVFNAFSTSAYNAYDYYTRAYGDNPEKIAKTQYVGSTREIVDFHIEKVKNIDKATKIRVLENLNPLILEYKKTALALAQKNNEIYHYNEMRDFENDDYAKAKQFHKPLLNAFINFFNADEALRYQSDSIQNSMQIEYLKELKAQGKTLDYLVGMALSTSKTMLLESQKNDFDKLDATKLAKAQLATRNILDQMTTFKTEKPKEFEANYQMSWFYNAFKDFVKEAQLLTNRVKTKKPFSQGDKNNLAVGSGWMVNGSVPSLLKKYNTVVERYNDMTK